MIYMYTFKSNSEIIRNTDFCILYYIHIDIYDSQI